jgi:hypothetical protein
VWDERYSAETYAYGKQPNDFLLHSYKRIPPGCVLCLAEGEGRNGVFLAQQGFQVLAVDASSVGMAKAQRLAQEKGVQLETRVADLNDFAIEPDSWDGIVSIFCHLPPPLRRRLHRQVVQGLRPGAVFILEAYTPEQLTYNTGGPPVAELTMRLAEVREELAGLEIRHGVELVREIHEGEYHNGSGAVLQIVAVKP